MEALGKHAIGTPVEAGHWLCGQLGVEPAALGWTEPSVDGDEFDDEGDEVAPKLPLDAITTLIANRDVVGLRRLRKAHGTQVFDDWLKRAYPFTIDLDPDTIRRLMRLPAFKPQNTLTLRVGEENRIAPSEDITVVEGIAHKGCITLAFGPPKSGKTFLILDLAFAIADAQRARWMAQEIVEHGPVVYVATEGHGGFWKRTRVPKDPLPDDFITALGKTTLIVSHDQGRSEVPHPDDILAAVWDATRKRGRLPSVLVIDTVLRTFGDGNVNQSDHMNAYVAAVRVIANLGIAVILIHHAAKATGTSLGSVALPGAVETIIVSKKLKEDVDLATDNLHHWRVDEARDDATTPWRGFRLDVVDVGLNARGRSVTSCKVEDLGVIPAANKPGRPTGSDMKDFMWGILRDLVATEGQEDQPGVPMGVPCVPEQRWRDETYRRTGDAKPDTKRRTFDRYRDQLLAEKRIGISDGSVWPEIPAQGTSP
jgi:hypothetical protein